MHTSCPGELSRIFGFQFSIPPQSWPMNTNGPHLNHELWGLKNLIWCIPWFLDFLNLWLTSVLHAQELTPKQPLQILPSKSSIHKLKKKKKLLTKEPDPPLGWVSKNQNCLKMKITNMILNPKSKLPFVRLKTSRIKFKTRDPPLGWLSDGELGSRLRSSVFVQARQFFAKLGSYPSPTSILYSTQETFLNPSTSLTHVQIVFFTFCAFFTLLFINC